MNQYWIGPYGVRVPLDIKEVVADDGGNTLYQDGRETEMFVEPSLTKEDYLSLYCHQRDDGYYYYGKEQQIDVPTMINVGIDVDLLEHKTNFVRHIVRLEQLNKDNYKRLAAFDCEDYHFAVTHYGCDVCSVECEETNPIYTNNQYQGADICTRCIHKAYPQLIPLPGWNPGPVYSLQHIVDIVKK